MDRIQSTSSPKGRLAIRFTIEGIQNCGECDTFTDMFSVYL